MPMPYATLSVDPALLERLEELERRLDAARALTEAAVELVEDVDRRVAALEGLERRIATLEAGRALAGGTFDLQHVLTGLGVTGRPVRLDAPHSGATVFRLQEVPIEPSLFVNGMPQVENQDYVITGETLTWIGDFDLQPSDTVFLVAVRWE